MDSEAIRENTGRLRNGRTFEVFLAFLKLGLTSFGGPIAHLGYFRDELVIRRKWISEQGYADIVALCQFLPGPASSQVGFALGLIRGGPLGAIAAWIAFTLPSAIILVSYAMAANALDNPFGQALLHGLKLVAVSVVAQAVWGMAKSLTPDRPRGGIALIAVVIVTFGGIFGQLAAIIVGAVAGLAFCQAPGVRQDRVMPIGVSKTIGVLCLLIFFVLLLGLPIVTLASGSHEVALFDAFYRSGSLVFGGGHVVLPLLQSEVVETGWVATDDFLAGYGLTQAVPGPLFTFAAYLGAVMGPTPSGMLGAAICLIAIFLPGFLLLLGALPFWEAINQRPIAQAAMRGANAAVVGILGSALYNPVWTSAVHRPADFALALVGFAALVVWKVSPWIVVAAMAVSAVVLQML